MMSMIRPGGIITMDFIIIKLIFCSLIKVT
jgi:hypothetical protein